MKIGVLHPGTMGVSVARSILDSGHDVFWASRGRSQATRDRATQHGLTDVGSLKDLCLSCEVVLSICPPEAASDLAGEVKATGFTGTFVDCNAISPQRIGAIADDLGAAGITVVDAGIIGPPAWKPDKTWLYVSGPAAQSLANLTQEGHLRTEVLGADIGTASALKMCYAAWTKGTTALVCAILASADELGVRDQLYRHWDRDQPGLSEQREMTMRGVTAKAWRFVGEMEEISATFTNAGQPGGFHQAAADLYRRLADLKDGPHPSPADAVLSALKARD